MLSMPVLTRDPSVPGSFYIKQGLLLLASVPPVTCRTPHTPAFSNIRLSSFHVRCLPTFSQSPTRRAFLCIRRNHNSQHAVDCSRNVGMCHCGTHTFGALPFGWLEQVLHAEHRYVNSMSLLGTPTMVPADNGAVEHLPSRSHQCIQHY